jgi:hypothetical protein
VPPLTIVLYGALARRGLDYVLSGRDEAELAGLAWQLD